MFHAPLLVVHCCFTSTETVRIIRDGGPKTSTSSFTQLLSSDMLFYPYTSSVRKLLTHTTRVGGEDKLNMVLNVHRNPDAY